MLFFQLLTGVNDENWSRGRVKGFLDGKNIAEADLVQWLRRFGENLLASDGENRELATRMVRLGEVGCGVLGEVAGEIGREFLWEEEDTGEEEKREAEIWFERGQQQFDAEDFEGSIASFDQALKFQPNDPEAWYGRGIVLASLERFEEAIISFNEAVELKPDFYEAWQNRGAVLADLKRFSEAVTSFDQALKIKPDDHEAWQNRGAVLAELKRLPEAIVSFDQALKIKPDSDSAWYVRGLVLHTLEHNEEAIASYDKALQIQPDKYEVWFERGLTLSKLEQNEEAIASYDKALQIQPDKYEVWFKRGLILSKLKRNEEAIASYEQVVKIEPYHYNAWNNWGNALLNLERFEEAIASYDKALKIKLDFHEAWNSRGVALANLDRFEDAIASYEQALEIKPNDYCLAWLNRGNALRKLGEFEQAIKSYDRALKIKPDFDEVWIGKGALLCDKFNQYEEAIACFDKALNFKPDEYRAWRNRGVAAGKSISFNQFLAIYNAITEQNSDLNKRDYEGELASYQEGLKYCQQDTHSEGWGILHQAIGNAHYYQGVGERNHRQYWFQAESEYHQALITLTKEAFPELHLDLLRGLIRVLFGLNKDEAAKEYRKQALAVFGELLNSPNKSSFQKRKLEAQFSGFSQMRVDVLIEDGDFISALETAERNKNFYLTWILDARKEQILSPSYSQIQKLINSPTNRNTAIIYWHISPFAITTFIIKPDADKPVVIPTQKPEKLEAWLKNWHTQYDNHRKGVKQQSSNPDWRDNLPQLLIKLGEILNISAIIKPIQNQNTQIQNLILIPHRDLHRFPLHALFPDEFTTTYLPSAQIGISLQQKQPISVPTSLLSVEAPNSKDSDDKPFEELPNAEIESVTICAMFANPQRIPGSTASKENIKTALANNHQIFHFTGHATYNYQRPKLSCLALSGTDRFTLEDITQLSLENYHLVSLSACETAITGNQTIDNEYVGLVSGFLTQGVTNVLSTLWTVESLSSALFMIEFYRQPNWNTAPAVALKRTQMWLRNLTYRELINWYKQRAEEITEKDSICAEDLLDEAAIIENDPAKINTTIPPYAHPYYWASFTITGKINS
ncbi:protein prenyltransferase, alpha subunit (plasmid) [Microchaete diplosiphon NIES-3275]|nr:protein prenyltransferase, alpha subunit [Microchaete diplosiphon NIES-3275]